VKVEIKKCEKTTFKNVVLREPTVGDYIAAERIAGSDKGFFFAACLLSQIAEFDGQRLPPEDITGLPIAQFAKLVAQVQKAGFLPELKDLIEQS
jgi:hypothetical protein